MRILVLDSLFESLEVERATAEQVGAEIARWSGDPNELSSADIVVHVRTRVDQPLIAKLTACRVIGRFGTGLDTVDLAAASLAGIQVVRVVDYCIPELCSHTLALAFSLIRRLRELGGLDASWEEVAQSRPIGRHGVAAVVGLGPIGRAVAQAVLAIGFEVLPVTRHEQSARKLGLAAIPLDDALGQAGLVFLHTAVTPDTAGLIDARRLGIMQPGAILVNTARLGLIDERATADSLRERRLGGLALDARLPPESPLRAFPDDPRVLITPHVGWYSEESAARLRADTIATSVERARHPTHEEALRQ